MQKGWRRVAVREAGKMRRVSVCGGERNRVNKPRFKKKKKMGPGVILGCVEMV